MLLTLVNFNNQFIFINGHCYLLILVFYVDFLIFNYGDDDVLFGIIDNEIVEDQENLTNEFTEGGFDLKFTIQVSFDGIKIFNLIHYR